MTARRRRFPRPLAVIAGLALVGFLTVVAGGVPAPSPEPGQREIARAALLRSSHWDRLARGNSAPGDDTPFTFTGTPLGPGGQEVTVPHANALLAICMDCLQLPPQGPMSAANGSEAWTRVSDLAVALQYADGVVFYVSASSDVDQQEWIDSWTADIAAGGWPGHMIDLRGRRAAATDRGSSYSASVSWMEASHLYEIYGHGGQRLDDLVQRAESLVSPHTMNAEERRRSLHLVMNVLRRGPEDTEPCPESLRVPLDQAILGSNFPVWFPSHQLASRENLAGVCSEGGATIAFLFRSARPPEDPLWFDGISIWEGRWGGGDPLTVYRENMAASPEDTGKKIHTVRGVPAQGDAAHDGMAGDAAYLELVLDGVEISLSGGESVEDLIAIAETLHQLSSKEDL